MIGRRDLLLGLGAFALIGAGRINTQVLGGAAFGSYWRATVPGHIKAQSVQRALAFDIRAINQTFSLYQDSELTRFAKADTTDWIGASAPLRLVSQAALDVARDSGGLFDPTLINEGYQGLEISGDAIRKSDPTLTLDFNAIAKGHALDVMTQTLIRVAGDDVLLELGGEVSARGAWTIGIERPGGGIAETMTLNNTSVATSARKRPRHIVDPRTGTPAVGALSVTVRHDSAMMADAWATALMVPPLSQAQKLGVGLDVMFQEAS